MCNIDAELSKHSWAKVRAEAARQPNGSGRSCSNLKHLGKEGGVTISGAPGRDYTVTGGTLMDF